MNNIRNVCFIFCIIFSISAYADDCTRYVDGVFNYSICLPQKWYKTFRDMGQRHILGSRQKGGVEISVSTSQFSDDEQLKWESGKRAYGRGIRHDFRSIIETKEIRAGEDATFKLLLFDYSSRIGRMLQRTMLMKYDDKLLVIECRAPVRSFARYTDLFNTIMSSVDLSGGLEGDNVETLKVAGTSPRKKTTIKKQAARKKPEKEKAVIPKVSEEKAKPEKKPMASEEVVPYWKALMPEEGESGRKIIKPMEIGPEIETRQTEEMKPFTEKAVDSETKRSIESELKKIQELEQKGIIEKIDE